MAMRLPAGAVNESATMAEMQRRLGQLLNRSITPDEWQAAMDDAYAARDRLSRHGITWGNIRETERHREILYVADHPRAAARTLYAHGRYRDDDGNTENWVIRWCIRHAFRNGDGRGNRTGGKTSTGGGGGAKGGGTGRPSSGSQRTQSAPRSQFYDPVRDNGR